MASTIDTLVTYLKTCPSLKDAAISIDRYAMTDGYSVAPDGYQIVKWYTRSRCLITRTYLISITAPNDTDNQRKSNAEVLEDIENWINSQASQREFPEIGKQVMRMFPLNGMAYDDMENGYTVYQIQLILDYIEER